MQWLLPTGLPIKWSGPFIFGILDCTQIMEFNIVRAHHQIYCLWNLIHKVILSFSAAIFDSCIYNLDSQILFSYHSILEGSSRSPVSKILDGSHINTLLLMVYISFMPTSSKLQRSVFFQPKSADRLSAERLSEHPWLKGSTHNWSEGDLFCPIYSMIKRMSEILLHSCFEPTGS